MRNLPFEIRLPVDGKKVITFRVKTGFLRVPYDIEKTASAIIESGLPPYFAEKLREGR